MKPFYETYIDTQTDLALLEAESFLKSFKKVKDPNDLYGLISDSIIKASVQFTEKMAEALNNKVEDTRLKTKIVSGIDYEIIRYRNQIKTTLGQIDKKYLPGNGADYRYIESMIDHNSITLYEVTDTITDSIAKALPQNAYFNTLKSSLTSLDAFIKQKKYKKTENTEKLLKELSTIKTKYEAFILNKYGVSVDEIKNNSKIVVNLTGTKTVYTGPDNILKISGENEFRAMNYILATDEKSAQDSRELSVQFDEVLNSVNGIKEVTKKDKENLANINAYITLFKETYKEIVNTRNSINNLIKKILIKSAQCKLKALNDFANLLNYIEHDINNAKKVKVSNKDYTKDFLGSIMKETAIIDQDDFFKIHGLPIDLDSLYDIYKSDKDNKVIFSDIVNYANKAKKKIEDEGAIVDLIKKKIAEGNIYNIDIQEFITEAVNERQIEENAKQTLTEFINKMNELSKNMSQSLSILFGKAKNVKNRNLITKLFLKKPLDLTATIKESPDVVTWINRMMTPAPFNLNNPQELIKAVNSGNTLMVEQMANKLNNFNLNYLKSKDSYHDLFRTYFLTCDVDTIRRMGLYKENVSYSNLTNETKLAMYNFINQTSNSIHNSIKRDMKQAITDANINTFKNVVGKLVTDKSNEIVRAAEEAGNPEDDKAYKAPTINVNTYATKFCNLVYTYFKIKIDAYYKLCRTILSIVNEYVKRSSPNFDITSQTEIANRVMDQTSTVTTTQQQEVSNTVNPIA